MKRTVQLAGTFAAVILLMMVLIGSVEKAESSDPCKKWISGYVYCDAGHTQTCSGARVYLADKWEHGNIYDDYTNSEGHFELGMVACDNYGAVVTCDDDCQLCNITVSSSGCTEDNNCPYYHWEGCIVHIHTFPSLCPDSK